MAETIDVLIVGAGPTGLMTATVLARAGINFQIVDNNSARTPYSKAVAVHAPTLEILDLLGVAPKFVELGYPTSGVNLWFGTTAAKIDLYDLPTSYPYLLILPQSETECILEENMNQLGYAVERNTEISDFEVSAAGVNATLHNASGTEKTVQARYLLSCQGAHSTIRHKLGLPFDGKAYALNALLGDMLVEGPLERNRLQIYIGKRGFLFLAAFQDGYVRIIANDLTKQESNTTDLTLEDLQETVDAFLPYKLTLKEPRWLTRFGAPFRIVPTYRQGPVFLLGDAAHVHSPAGGQGMNMGLQDAYNLGWKLAMVLKEQAPLALLDTYNAERHTVDKEIMSMTDLQLQNATHNQAVVRLAQRTAVAAFSKISSLHKFITQHVSGLSYDYTKIYKSDQAGQRLPDLELFQHHQPQARLYDLLRHSGYSLLVFATASNFAEKQAHLTELLLQVQQHTGDLVQPYLLLDEDLAGVRDFGWPVAVDFKHQFRDTLKVKSDSLFLVRPDRYVAYQTQNFDWPSLQSALQKWVTLRESIVLV